MSGGFLGRWSQRKLSQKQEEEARREASDSPDFEAETVDEGTCDTPSQAESQEISAATQNAETLSEEELAALPPIDSINRETDIRAFMRKGVPAALKTAALRKMWLADPAIRNHADCAVDYAWDWNTPGGVPGNGGRLASESVTKMLDSILPKPVSPENQAEGDNAEIAESVPSTKHDPVRNTKSTQSEGDSGSKADEARREGSATVPDDADQRKANDAPVESKVGEPASSRDESDAVSRVDGDIPVRPKRHGGAVPL